MDFFTGRDPEKTWADLYAHPIKVEFWGGAGTRHEATMYLKKDDAGIRYVEAKRPFLISADNKKIKAISET